MNKSRSSRHVRNDEEGQEKGCIVALQTGALGKLVNVNKKEKFC
jgi:hypothetical protein